LTQLQLLSHRTKIRKRLRDKGVLIARGGSGERKGYKLPSSLAGVWLILIRGVWLIIIRKGALFYKIVLMLQYSEWQ